MKICPRRTDEWYTCIWDRKGVKTASSNQRKRQNYTRQLMIWKNEESFSKIKMNWGTGLFHLNSMTGIWYESGSVSHLFGVIVTSQRWVLAQNLYQGYMHEPARPRTVYVTPSWLLDKVALFFRIRLRVRIRIRLLLSNIILEWMRLCSSWKWSWYQIWSNIMLPKFLAGKL